MRRGFDRNRLSAPVMTGLAAHTQLITDQGITTEDEIGTPAPKTDAADYDLNDLHYFD
jgi:hypothetical protein